MKIIAIKTAATENGIAITRSDIGICFSDDLEELLDFIRKDTDDSLLLAWNLDETVAPILRKLGEELCKKLWDNASVEYRKYSIFYVQNKVFAVSLKKEFGKNVSIYHLSQYFSDEVEPEDINGIVQYGERLVEANHKMKLYGKKYSSPIALFEQCVLKYTDMPTMKNSNMPMELAEWAWECAGKQWVEAFKIGHWDKAYAYDLSSAYSSVLRDMIDIRECDFVKDTKYHPEAFYGFCKGIVTINDNVTVHPVMHELIDMDEKRFNTPVGIYPEKITKAMWDFIRRWKIGYYELEAAWWIIPQKPLHLKFPLRNLIERLWKFKASDDKLISSLAKRTINSLYGKSLEERKKGFGEFFNPVWGCYCSDLTKLEVCRQIYTHKAMNNLIHISVDGFETDKPLSQIAREHGIICNCEICKEGL